MRPAITFQNSNVGLPVIKAAHACSKPYKDKQHSKEIVLYATAE